jgi:drug/metabolite transporter (DMT)-like permease
MAFARLLNGETITPTKAVGATVILVGVCLTIHGASRDGNEDSLTPKQVHQLSRRPAGIAYLSCLIFGLAAAVSAISWYERTYPIIENQAPPAPPWWLDRIMGLVYPGS